MTSKTTVPEEHPIAPFLRMDRMPHIWCPTCGIGTIVKCFATALDESDIDLDKTAIVSGIGCTGRVAGYMNLDAFHSTHGRAIPFATGLKLGRPELQVIVFSGDGDLSGIGGNHFIHAARRNMDILVILVNNFIYGMTGGQNAPTTPLTARSSTMPFGNFERPFNLPHLAESRCHLRRTLDVFAHPSPHQMYSHGAAPQGVPLHRGDRAVFDPLCAPQPARQRPRPDAVLPR
jgi:2-oxoglutarate ferredoxin oxidoreductase subunit beta